MYEPLSLGFLIALIRPRSEWVDSFVGAEGWKGEDLILPLRLLKSMNGKSNFHHDDPEICGVHRFMELMDFGIRTSAGDTAKVLSNVRYFINLEVKYDYVRIQYCKITYHLQD